ncbi:hypothetical protein [uncultured Flavobacterium sp.]|uniref:hypothetical protein n=1 Tax=uncultured Flavobacterium sp. TaxID=165435 RepID=UPI0025DFD3EF|nr:hypothetical protein [uncultured Flavobacterium sp.]
MLRAILFLFLLAPVAQGQTSQLYGVYLTAEDFAAEKLASGFDAIGTNDFDDSSQQFLRITLDSIAVIYDYKKIWGFRKKGVDWRIYDGDIFEVSYRGNDIIIYTLPGYLSYDQPIVYDTRFFSTDASGKLLPLTKRNLKRIYGQRAGFIEKMDSLPRPATVAQWNRECRCYPVSQWLQ